MDVSFLRPVFAAAGPYATAPVAAVLRYTDASTSS
jgi:hypothetical protein